MVSKKEGDSNQDISAYILPSLPRYLRAEPAGLAGITTRLYFIIDGPGDACEFPAC